MFCRALTTPTRIPAYPQGSKSSPKKTNGKKRGTNKRGGKATPVCDKCNKKFKISGTDSSNKKSSIVACSRCQVKDTCVPFVAGGGKCRRVDGGGSTRGGVYQENGSCGNAEQDEEYVDSDATVLDVVSLYTHVVDAAWNI